MDRDVVIIGAGISGLTLARALREAGLTSVVLERARGVGGRCATRRVEGQPVDHGVGFLHGRDPRFLGELEAVADATPVLGWPRVIRGHGVPCQPEAFDPSETRLAFREGVSRLAKHLARGSEVWLNSRVERLRPAARGPGRAAGTVRVELEAGEGIEARAVVLAMPAPQASRLLEPLAAASPAGAEARALLGLVRMATCATVIARYPAGVAAPEWDACYPDGARPVHLVFHDSAKRGEGAALTLVVQGRPGYSRSIEERTPEVWAEELLRDAAEAEGGWIAAPASFQTHLWRAARVHRTSELAAPLLFALEDGAALALCGDGFHVAAGVEGAYLSGLALAGKLAAHRLTPAAG